MEQTQYEAFLKLETKGHSARINQILVTPDDKKLITAGRDKTIRIWDVESKKADGMLLGQIGPGLDGEIQAIALNPNGANIVTLVWRYLKGSTQDLDRLTEVRVYQLATGNLQASFDFPGTLYDLDFSPDGKFLAVTGNPRRQVRRGYVYVFNAREIMKGFGSLPSPRKRHLLYDNDSLVPSYVRFIPDKPVKPAAYRLVVASWIHHKKGEEDGYDGPEYTGKILWYSYSPATGMKEITRCDQIRKSPTAKPIHPDSLAVSREYVVITGDHKKLEEFYCYDHRGQLVAAIPTDTRPARPAFSRNGRWLIVGQQDDSPLVQVEVYRTTTRPFQLKSVYYGHDADTVAVALLDDGTAVSAGGDQNAIHFWSPAHLEGEQIAVIRGTGRTVHAVGVNEDDDGRVYIGVGHHDDMRLENGRIILQRVFDLHTLELQPLSLMDATAFRRSQKESADGHKLKFMEKDGNWNLYLLGEEFPLAGEPGSNFPWYEPTTFGFTEKGTVITGDRDGNVRIEALGNDTAYERDLVGHTAPVLDHAAGSKWLATAGADQVIRLWYLEDVERLVDQGPGRKAPPLEPALNLFIGMDDEWVIWSRGGYFYASQKGDNRFGYHVNRGKEKEALFVPGNRFVKSFLRPDIIRAIVECGSEERAIQTLRESGLKIGKIDVSTILPPIIEMEQDGVEVKDQSFVTLKFTVESLDRRSPIARIWMVQNDTYLHFIPETDWKRVRSRSMKYKIEASLALQPGNNSIKILAQNKDTTSIPYILDIDGPLGARGKVPDNGTLYLLSVGVAELDPTTDKGPYKPLRFADEDAISIYNAFARTKFSYQPQHRGKNKAFKSVKARLLLNEKATKQGILAAIDDLASQVDSPDKKSGVEDMQRDVLFVFLSGHGIRNWDASELYFWNYDLDFDAVKIGGTGLSFTELGRKLTEFPAADIILVIDACKSGTAVKNVGEIDPNELAKQLYSINERGMYILSAARSGELAWEDTDVGHGFFTRSILDKVKRVRAGESVNMLGLIDSVQSGVQEYMRRYKRGNFQTPVCRMYGDLLPLTVYKKGRNDRR